MNILISGTAGFIGFYLVKRLLNDNHTIYGIDSVNNYYDTTLKEERLRACGIENYEYGKEIKSEIDSRYTFCQMD